MQNYIGVKQIKAAPMTRGVFHAIKYPNTPINTEVFSGEPSEPGYLVQYEDGYKSWSPKATFERAYLPQGDDETRITEQMVDNFIVGYLSMRSGNHTVVRVLLRNGFTLIEESACVDPKNYDRALGENYALEKAKKRVWHLLGFLLASARNGLLDDSDSGKIFEEGIITNG